MRLYTIYLIGVDLLVYSHMTTKQTNNNKYQTTNNPYCIIMETKQIKLTDDQKSIIKEAFTLEVDRVTEFYYGKGGGIEQGYYDEREYRKDIAKVMDTYELIMSSFDKN